MSREEENIVGKPSVVLGEDLGLEVRGSTI